MTVQAFDMCEMTTMLHLYSQMTISKLGVHEYTSELFLQFCTFVQLYVLNRVLEDFCLQKWVLKIAAAAAAVPVVEV